MNDQLPVSYDTGISYDTLQAEAAQWVTESTQGSNKSKRTI